MKEPTLGLAEGLRLSGLSISDLESRYLTLGGTSTLEELCRHVDGAVRCSRHEHNVIAQAINEAFLDKGEEPAVGYRDLFELPPTA